ncbi:MAG: hypothetical protein WC516_05830 [Patescibacteria group bacterium]|jgi:hypothetical protein
MAWNPSARLYNSDGITLIYTISDILMPIDGWPNTNNPASIILSNAKSQGEIPIPIGNLAYDITIRGRLTAGSYTNLITAFTTLQSTIAANTHYYLKIDTSESTTDAIKVMRLQSINPFNTDNWVSWCYYAITFRANSWV